MTTQIEALMALADTYADGPHTEGYFGAHRAALEKALRAALAQAEAQPAAEPVAWRWRFKVDGGRWAYMERIGAMDDSTEVEALYAHPAPAEIERLRFDREHLLAVHAQDQEEIKRLRVVSEPLTDAQIDEIFLSVGGAWGVSLRGPAQNVFAQAIEAAHGIKAKP